MTLIKVFGQFHGVNQNTKMDTRSELLVVENYSLISVRIFPEPYIPLYHICIEAHEAGVDKCCSHWICGIADNREDAEKMGAKIEEELERQTHIIRGN